MTNSDRLAASSGMQVIDDTNNHTGQWDYFLPREDTVISVCTGLDANGNAKDFKVSQNWDGTMISTDFCCVKQGEKILSITLTSGSIQCF